MKTGSVYNGLKLTGNDHSTNVFNKLLLPGYWVLVSLCSPVWW